MRSVSNSYLARIFLVALSLAIWRSNAQDHRFKRCEIVPLPANEVSFRIGGLEKLRWHYGGEYPRPFFFPFNGPSGESLTRMGHPGAPDHDHHRSLWFAHHQVNGVDFWSDQTEARIRQRSWYAYVDGDAEAIMASALIWYDGEGVALMEQDLVSALRSVEGGEHALELQITMRPGSTLTSVELGKTNFGFLAVRVAQSVSEFFGSGKLTNSEDLEGEPETFGQRARWMDYSGPVAVGEGLNRRAVIEGITYFDHPDNPHYPNRWHVREDGWMGTSVCMEREIRITRETPLTLRYLLQAHSGEYDPVKAEKIHRAFAGRPGFAIEKSARKHRHFEVKRIDGIGEEENGE